MSIVERLQAIVREKNTTFKQLEREAGLGNGTIRRWEGQSPRLDKLVRVADYLHVSLDYLVYGRTGLESSEATEPQLDFKAVQEAQRLMCDGSPLEDEEADLVAMYRLLPDPKQEDVFDIVLSMYKRHVEKKKESIYSAYTRSSSKRAGDPAGDGSSQGGIA